MGLSIKNYHYSYRFLHVLRQAALKVEKNQFKLMCMNYEEINSCGKCFYCNKTEGTAKTKFEEFIWHCDCDGGYVSKKSKQYKKYIKKGYGDLDKLKKECEILNKSIHNFLDGWSIHGAWKDYYKDITSSKMLLHYR